MTLMNLRQKLNAINYKRISDIANIENSSDDSSCMYKALRQVQTRGNKKEQIVVKIDEGIVSSEKGQIRDNNRMF